MRQITHKTILAASAAVAIAGCSSSKDATEQNFATAISEKLAANPALCAGFFDFPEKVDDRFSNDGRALRSLEKIGFVASHPASTQDGMGRPIPLRAYVLTDLGKQNSDGRRFCYGRLALDKVIEWSPVQDVPEVNAKVTVVKFVYRIDKLADWAKQEDIQSAMPDIKASLAGVAEHKPIRLAMTLRGDRWTIDSPGPVTP